jgi:hypothetical protein
MIFKPVPGPAFRRDTLALAEQWFHLVPAGKHDEVRQWLRRGAKLKITMCKRTRTPTKICIEDPYGQGDEYTLFDAHPEEES